MLTIKGEIVEELSKTDQTIPNGISLFPNPTKGPLTLKVDNGKGKPAFLEIFDSAGQLVKQSDIKDAGAGPIQLDASTFTNGQYYLSVKIGEKDRVNLPFVIAK